MVDPVAFPLFGHDIRWYGLFVAAGFLLACVNWRLLEKPARFPDGFGLEFGFVVMSTGIVGARLAHVLGRPAHFFEHPGEILRIDAGGLTFYGGFVLAFLCGALLARRRGLPVIAVADYGVAGLALGHGIGRIGCLLNGCCYGAVTDCALGVHTAGATRWPVQGFEALYNIGLCAALNLFYLRHRDRRGGTLALYLLAYGTWRFGIEFLRVDPRTAALGLSGAQWTSLLLVAAGVATWRWSAGVVEYWERRKGWPS
jgi:phosphatidylglycerol:prolipoprotein diacylglycerol transferase